MTSLTAQTAAKTIPSTAAALPALAPAAAPPPDGYLRPFANERLNSRLGNRLPSGDWKETWSVSIDAAMAPTYLLTSGNSVLAVGRTACQAIGNGKVIAHIVSAGEDAELLPTSSEFLASDRYSRVGSFSLSTGDPTGYLSANGGDDTMRTFVHRRGAHTVVASFDGSSSPHKAVKKQVVYLQVFNGDAETAARDGEMPRLALAMHNDFIVLARAGAIEFLDLTLQAPRRIDGVMKPQGLSVDESGRVYLVCEAGQKQQLWIVAPSGEYQSVAMPSAVFHRPPVVGFDHRVYLLALNKIVTVDASGKPGWVYDAPARVAGATVTADGMLLAGVGDSVVSLDSTGRARTLCRTPGEQLMASPILSADNKLLVLTDRKVHSFSAG